MNQRSLTIGLVCGNLLGWGALALFLLYLLGMPGLHGSSAFPEISPLRAQAFQLPAALAPDSGHNPFDPSRTPWKASRANADAKPAAASDIRGVVQLPGVRAIVTGSGTVRQGEPMAGGKFAGIRDDRIIIEQEGGNRSLDLPVDRPTLESLSKPGDAQVKPAIRQKEPEQP